MRIFPPGGGYHPNYRYFSLCHGPDSLTTYAEETLDKGSQT